MAIPISGQNGETIVGQTTDVRHILETPGRLPLTSMVTGGSLNC